MNIAGTFLLQLSSVVFRQIPASHGT